jgi:hypothetical protein
MSAPFHHRAARIAVLSLLALALSAMSGCGPGYGDVSGTVSYNGKRLRFGTVTIVGSDGIPRYGNFDADGNYSIEHIAAGECKVAVASPNPKGLPGYTPEERRISSENWFEIPAKYLHPLTSELTYTLRPGRQTYNMELK